MREFAAPEAPAVPAGSLADDVVRNGREHPDQPVLARRDGAGGWVHVTAAELLHQVTAAAKGLLASGVRPGDRVLLMSRTRPEWTVLDYAVWSVGAVSVPVYDSASTDQLAWLLEDTGAEVAVVETEDHRQRLAATGRALREVWCLDAGGLDALGEQGAAVGDAEVEERRASVGPGSVATIVYTSGTTGAPRGCVLTHANFQHEVDAAVAGLDELFAADDAATLLVLPLAHVFARVVQVGAVRQRVLLGFSPDVRRLQEDLRSFRPTFLLAVPRVLEKLYNTASQAAVADGRGRLFERAAATAIAHSRASDTGRPGPVLRLRHATYDRAVYRDLRASLGGRCRWVVSGGAPLGERLGHFYRGIGVPALEGYGLSETTAAVTVNSPGALKIGSVGRPLAGTTVRVDEDGQLLVRGGQVQTGYWDAALGSARPRDDAWLATGDLGEIDDEGFVRVTGRQKEILVTAGGKNVSPSALEAVVRAHRLVGQCLVVGDGRPFVAALVTLDAEAVRVWAAEHGRSKRSRDLVDDPDLLAEVQAAVDEANGAVSQAESIRRFTVLPEDWTEDSGLLTPSLKVRRTVALTRFRREIERLYES